MNYDHIGGQFLNNGGYVEAPEIITDELKHLLQCHYKMIVTNNYLPTEASYSLIPGETDGKFSLLTSELLLLYFTDIYSKIVNKNLAPTYSYTRTYYKGSELGKHTDRSSCQYSMTLNIGASSEDPWPFFCHSKTLEGATPTKLDNPLYTPILYKGQEVRHWREVLTKTHSTHVFLHYIDQDDPDFVQFKYDKRSFVGI